MSIFEQDITQIELGLIPGLVREGILQESTAFADEITKLFEFAFVIYGALAVSHSLFSDPRAEPAITDAWGSEDWQEIRDRQKSQGSEWEKILSETLFLRGYQSFESFLLRVYICIYYIFPRFLASPPDNILLGQASFTDLYGATSILQVRRSFIENRVSSELQARNIKEAIQLIGTKFGIDLGLDLEDLKSLVQNLADRNILIHNHGIVNELYLIILRKNKISVPYGAGERISIDKVYLTKTFELFRKLATQIRTAILENTEHIMKYYQGKFGVFP